MLLEINARRASPLVVLMFAVLWAGCTGTNTPASDGAAAPPADAPGGTEVITLDPTAVTVDESRAPQTGRCEASALLAGRPGAYQCTTEAGAVLDPCFVLEGSTLICNPNPVFDAYSQRVTATNPLPDAGTSEGEPIVLWLQLDGNYPPCERRNEPMVIERYPVTYACQAPGAFIVGPLDTSQPTWVAQYVTTDTSVTTVTSGPEAVDVATAWVY